MTPSVLEQLEADIEQLSLIDQLRLMERLAHRISKHARPSVVVQEGELIAMANDPAIQKELRQIDAEFAATETDGLGLVP